MSFTNIVFTAPGETFSKTASINVDAFPSVEEAIASVAPEGSRWEALSPHQKSLPEGFLCDLPPEPLDPSELTTKEKLDSMGITIADLKAELGIA